MNKKDTNIRNDDFDSVLILDVDSMYAAGCTVFWKDGTNQLEFHFKNDASSRAGTELHQFFEAMEYSPSEAEEMSEAISKADIRITVGRLLSAHMTRGGFAS